MSFEGPNRDYMGSLARLFEGVQVLGKSFSSISSYVFAWMCNVIADFLDF